jgi:hypothetical protein
MNAVRLRLSSPQYLFLNLKMVIGDYFICASVCSFPHVQEDEGQSL